MEDLMIGLSSIYYVMISQCCHRFPVDQVRKFLLCIISMM